MVRTNASWRARFWHRERPTADLPSSGAAPQDDAEDRLRLAAALAALPLRQRQAVVLRYYEDLAVETVAEIMGSTTGTVKSQFARGLSKLRAALAADDDLHQERR